MKLVNIVGTRPNFVKIAPIISALKNSSEIEQILVHTGQHYDRKMSVSFFEELEIPMPDINLNIGSHNQAVQVAEIMKGFDSFCEKNPIDAILVVGDVNSTMACSLVASKRGIKVIHVEAGIRSWDRTMPEEINRLVTDSISDLLLTPTKMAGENLLREGHSPKNIRFVGNIMIDSLQNMSGKIDNSAILEKLNLKDKEYGVITIHRPSNVDNEDKLKQIVEAIEEICRNYKLVFPIHVRTMNRLKEFNLEMRLKSLSNLILLEPTGYVDFGRLVKSSQIVFTDSGGVQEETTVYGIPCITLRDNTERPITVDIGTSVLCSSDKDEILKNFRTVLAGNWKEGEIPEYWDGRTADRILTELVDFSKRI